MIYNIIGRTNNLTENKKHLTLKISVFSVLFSMSYHNSVNPCTDLPQILIGLLGFQANVYKYTSLETQGCWFYRYTKFSLLKNLKLETQNQAIKTFPLVSRIPQSKYESNRSRGSWVTIGQTEFTTLYI